MKIFFVAQRVPFPPDRGDKIATFNEVRHLAQSHEVHVFCLADGDADLENVEGLREIATGVTAVRLSRMRARARALFALGTGRAFTEGYFNERELHRAIQQRYRELQPDVVLVYSSGMAQYADRLKNVPRVMQFGDLDSLKWQQYALSASYPMKWVYDTEAKRLLAYERHIAKSFDLSLMCTEAEKTDFEKLIPGARVSCVANGVDLDYFRSNGVEKKPGSLVFTGVMDYLPNVDGVVWFAEEILPRVREQVPSATFTICGSRPSSRIESLGSQAGVIVTGRVPDVRPYLDAAEVAVVPLRMARGIQNKLLEAMSMGLPCVTTSRAWRGVDTTEGQGVVVVDDPAKFAGAVVALLQNDERRRESGRQARHAVERDYSWGPQLARLEAVLADVTRTDPRP
jgi:sugar transferase (PEP-CTERM/EpsH1 system associated)